MKQMKKIIMEKIIKKTNYMRKQFQEYFVTPQCKKILIFPDALRGRTALQCKEPLKYF